MTQPIDVAYVDIRGRTKDFSKDVDKGVSKELKKIDKQAADTADSVGKAFHGAGLKVGDLFRDINGHLRDRRAGFQQFGQEAAGAVGEGLSAAAKTGSASIQQLLSLFGNMTGLVGQLATAGPAGIAVLAAAAIESIVIIAGAGLAALPGLITAAVSGFAILGVALSGITDAFKEQRKGAKKAAGAAANNARQVADAQRGVLQAQKDLDDARKNEIKRIRELNTELMRARVTEARATDDVLNAQLELNDARNLGSPRAVREAELRLQEANASLAEAKDRTKSLADEKAKADKNGVEGSDQVLRAQEALRDAQDRLAASQQKVGAAAAATATAYGKLSHNAQLFVDALVAAAKELEPIKKGIQDAFFQGTAPLIDPIVENIKELQPEINRVAAGFGKLFQEVLKFLGSDAGKELFDSVLTGLANFLEAVAPSIGPLLEAFGKLAEQSGEFGDELGTTVADALLAIADFVKNVDLKQLFEDAKKEMDRWFPVIVATVSIVKDLLNILAELGRFILPIFASQLSNTAAIITFLSDTFDTVVGDMKDFTKTIVTQVLGAFKQAQTTIDNFPQIISGIGTRVFNAAKGVIKQLLEGLGIDSGAAFAFAKSLGNALIRVINTQVIGNLNRALDGIEASIRLLPFFGDVNLPTIPTIPQLAKGGLAVGNTLAEIGEGGKKEAVLPLTDSRAMSAIADAITNAGGVGAGQGQITVFVTVGDETILAKQVRVVRQSNKKTARNIKQVPRMI